MNKKLIYATGLLWGTVNCGHLVLNTSQKIDFTNKRIILIEKSIAQKLTEKAFLEKKFKEIEKSSAEIQSLGLLQAQLHAINAHIIDLQNSIAIAKNSIQSLLSHQ